jgi:prolyl-tRNA editing enzyme YbaK/EbsC (Cys-tRNA(Pro) deacylase)
VTTVVDHLLGLGTPFLALPAPAALSPSQVARRHGLDPAELVWTEVVMTIDGPVAMAIGAGASLDLERARTAVGDPAARLASHDEVRAFARGCEVGAVPPLSRFLAAPVYVDTPITTLAHVVFPAGVVSVLLCMVREDLFAVEPVRVAPLSRAAGPDPEPVPTQALSVVAPSRRAVFSGEPLVPYHLRAG